MRSKYVPPRTEEERREQAEERHDKADTDKWLVWYTGVLAVATILLTFATGMLWLSTKRLVEGAEETAKRQLRAYLHDNVHELRFTDKGAVIRVQMQNFGPTPAYDVRLGMNADILPTNQPWRDVHDGKSQVHAIGPGATHWQNYALLTDKPILPAMNDGRMVLHVWGFATYRDAFNITRTTKFHYTAVDDFNGGWKLGINDGESSGNEAT